MRRAAALLAALLAGIANGPGPVLAHPHVWVEAELAFVFAAGKVEALELRWLLDEMFSASLLQSYVPGPDGRFDREEAAGIEGEAFASLKESAFLAHLKVDGAPVSIQSYRGFEPSVRNGRLVYSFALPFPEPVDPTRRKVAVGLYDERFYVEVTVASDAPVRIEGDAPAGCAASLRKDPENPIYFGLLVPLVAELSCEGP